MSDTRTTTRAFPRVTTEVPGPRSREIFERQAKVFYTQMQGTSSPFVLDHKTDDDLLHDVDGNTYANHMSAWGASPYGSFPAAVRRATIEAWDRYGMEISCFLQSPPVVELAERLVALAPERITRVAPTVTGTEAVEGAIKLARHATGRPMILAFLGQYHGESTYLAQSTSTELAGNTASSALFAPGVVYAPYPSSYRTPFARREGQRDESGVLDYIEEWLLRHQLEASQEFWDGLHEMREKYGWLIISDEIQSGMGRSGVVWAGDLWGLEPDLLLIGKGFSAGGQPMAAILGTDAVLADTPVHTTGTYVWEPAAVAGALAGLDLLDDAIENAKELDRIGKEVLLPLIERYEGIGDVRQFGAWAGIEFVTDKVSKNPDADAQRRFHDAAVRRGVFAISSPEKWVYRMQPPLTMDPELFRWSCEQLVAAADEVYGA